MKKYTPPSPSEFLREMLSDTTTEHASKCLKMPRPYLSNMLNGKQRITPHTALKLEKALNTPATIWLQLQSDYDLWVARQNPPKRIRKIYD